MCEIISLIAALSQIDLAMAPDETGMGMSKYAVDYDEKGVIARVKALHEAVQNADIVLDAIDEYSLSYDEEDALEKFRTYIDHRDHRPATDASSDRKQGLELALPPAANMETKWLKCVGGPFDGKEMTTHRIKGNTPESTGPWSNLMNPAGYYTPTPIENPTAYVYVAIPKS